MLAATSHPNPPFSAENQLTANPNLLVPNTQAKDLDVDRYLQDELSFQDYTGKEDPLQDPDTCWWLWVAGLPAEFTKPLHYHKVLGREVVIAEQMRLHLTWGNTVLFLKPIPKVLLNHEFFAKNVSPNDITYQRAMGYLHTYLRLIKHESDFDLARKLRLLPENTTWDGWVKFTSDFPKFRKTKIPSRWNFGELRIHRINLVVQIFRLRPLRGWISLEKDSTQYFTPYFAIIAALFAVLSLVLSAFQVAMAPDWKPEAVSSAGFWFAIATLACTAALVVIIICWFIALLLGNLGFIFRRVHKGSHKTTISV
jgi:hypothetical protein